MGFLLLWIATVLVAPFVPSDVGPAETATFQDLRAELEERAAARREGREPVIAPRRVAFDNLAVIFYLLPLLLVKGLDRLAQRRQISPFAFLATLCGLWLAAWLIWETIIFFDPLNHALNFYGPISMGYVVNFPKLLLLIVLAVVAGIMGVFGLIGTVTAWLVYLPRQLDRWLKPRIVMRSRRITGSTKTHAGNLPNLLLVGGIGLLSGAALWQICDVVDGLGSSSFALALRTLLLGAAAWWLIRTHNRIYFA